MIITIAATKGGVGKSTLAWELAPVLDAVLVDFDFDSGGVTGRFDAAPPSARMLDALERDRTPRPRRAKGRPDLVPSHPDLGASLADPDLVGDALANWASEWGRPVIVDTHPGSTVLGDAALAVADLVLVPVVLGTAELRALAGMLSERGGHPLLLVPTMVPRSLPRRMVEQLEEIAAGRPVASPVGEHRFLRRRLRRTPLHLETHCSAQVARARADFRRLGEEVRECLTALAR